MSNFIVGFSVKPLQNYKSQNGGQPQKPADSSSTPSFNNGSSTGAQNAVDPKSQGANGGQAPFLFLFAPLVNLFSPGANNQQQQQPPQTQQPQNSVDPNQQGGDGQQQNLIQTLLKLLASLLGGGGDGQSQQSQQQPPGQQNAATQNSVAQPTNAALFIPVVPLVPVVGVAFAQTQDSGGAQFSKAPTGGDNVFASQPKPPTKPQ